MKLTKKHKVGIIILVIIICIFSLFIYIRSTTQLNSFKQKETALNEFVNEIKRYGKIKNMSINIKHFENSLNEKYYVFEKERADTLKLYRNKKVFFIDDLLRDENIDKDIFEKFKNKLIELNLNQFYANNNNRTIEFPISPGRYGYIYDESLEKEDPFEKDEPSYHRKKLAENWYYWSF